MERKKGGPTWTVEHYGYLAEEPMPDEPEGKLAHSNWFVTFNTNKTQDVVDPKHLAVLVKQHLTPEFIRESIYYIDEKKKRIAEDHYHLITNAKTQSAVEIGGKMHFVHVHVMLCFDHYTRMRLDYDGFKERLNEKLADQGITLVYANYHFYKDARQNFREYLMKTKYHDGPAPQERGPSQKKFRTPSTKARTAFLNTTRPANSSFVNRPGPSQSRNLPRVASSKFL